MSSLAGEVIPQEEYYLAAANVDRFGLAVQRTSRQLDISVVEIDKLRLNSDVKP